MFGNDMDKSHKSLQLICLGHDVYAIDNISLYKGF